MILMLSTILNAGNVQFVFVSMKSGIQNYNQSMRPALATDGVFQSFTVRNENKFSERALCCSGPSD